MVFSRSQIARVAHRVGITRLIATLAHSPCLLVLCYHRVGNAEHTDYDPDVYSATEDELNDQIAYLKHTYGITTLEDVLDSFSRGSWKHTRVLLTFDDGYLDNYKAAYPILRSYGVQGTFLLATDFVGTSRVPWWDAICYMIGTSGERWVWVPSLSSQVFDKKTEGPVSVMRRILRLYRATEDPDPGKVIQELENSCKVACPRLAPRRRFLNWDEAREMHAGGMVIGSHSRSHSLLGGLSIQRQREEAEASRDRITRELGVPPRVFALPCGSSSTGTGNLLREARYDVSLSIDSGVNRVQSWDPYRVSRVLVDRDELKESSRLRLAILTSGSRLRSLARI
jgi:peptidoglycan/xylan/chitin deacetylase (PgdA/CDA1 family)